MASSLFRVHYKHYYGTYKLEKEMIFMLLVGFAMILIGVFLVGMASGKK